MAENQYIPLGQTSLVVSAEDERLQIQTEYSTHPYARIATTVTNSGQVVHKIERKLKRAVASEEEQSRLERVMRQQHSDIVRTIEGSVTERAPEVHEGPAVKTVHSETHEDPEAVEQRLAELESASSTAVGIAPENEHQLDSTKTDLVDRLREIPGLEHVFHLDAEGNFRGQASQKLFKKSHSKLFKSIPELMSIFSMLEGDDPARESGVCEIEYDRVYYASAGRDCYFITVKREDPDTDFEKEIKSIICPR